MNAHRHVFAAKGCLPRKSPAISDRAVGYIGEDVQAQQAEGDISSYGRCRLCIANDHDGVMEQIAADLWESRRNGHLDGRRWLETGEYWQRTFREFASAAVESLTAIVEQ